MWSWRYKLGSVLEQFGLLCAIFGVGIADEVFGFAHIVWPSVSFMNPMCIWSLRYRVGSFLEHFGLRCAIFGVGIADQVFGFADVVFCRWLLLTRNVDGMFSNFRETMPDVVQQLTEMVSWRGLGEVLEALGVPVGLSAAPGCDCDRFGKHLGFHFGCIFGRKSVIV